MPSGHRAGEEPPALAPRRVVSCPAMDPIPRPAGTRFATRGVARLAYDRAGVPAGRTPVVLLHALLADRTALAALRDALAGERVVLSPDCRGHGASAAVAGRRLTVADLAADVVAVLDAEGVGAAHLVGHGLGGAVAVALAGAAPGRARSLVLVEPAVGGVLDRDPTPAPEAFALRQASRAAARAAADAADKELTDRALDLWLDPRWGRGWRDRLTRPRLGAIRRHAGALAGCLGALDAFAGPAMPLTGLGVPILLALGDAALAENRLVVAHLAAGLAEAPVVIPSPDEPDPGLGAAGAAALAAHLVAFLDRIEAADRTDR